MRYQFVDCRWELGRPGRGWELYLAGHVPGASHLFEEPGTLEEVARLAADWFARHVAGRSAVV